MGRVLLLESDKMLVDNLSLAFRRAGHKVDWQIDPQAAIDSADKNTPDVVVMELSLAGRSGIEFLHEFRSYPEWQRLPVIIYSEVPADELLLSGSSTQFGVSAFLYKPQSSLRELIEAVKASLALTPA